MNKILFVLSIMLFNFVIPLWAWEVDLRDYYEKPLMDCENNIPCSRLSRWQCISPACGQNGNQRPTDCYAQFDADKAQADLAICQAASLPTEDNIQAAVNAIPGARVEDVVHGLMMIRAIQGDGAGCQERIKEYVGPYGKSWSTFWVSAMSGCRILSNERSWQEEESDYQVWNEVNLGEKKCPDILDVEMQAMCNAGVLLGENI
jgi:hypothetical protein